MLNVKNFSHIFFGYLNTKLILYQNICNEHKKMNNIDKSSNYTHLFNLGDMKIP